MRLAIIVACGLSTIPAAAQTPTETLATSEAKRFCAGIIDEARERRYAIKQRELEELGEKIAMRVESLKARQAEYESWVKRRDDFMAQASQTLVDIYTNMRPDAAALRLERLNDGLVASILMKMPVKGASTVLNEMKSKKAAAVTAVIAASGQSKKGRGS